MSNISDVLRNSNIYPNLHLPLPTYPTPPHQMIVVQHVANAHYRNSNLTEVAN